MKKRTIITTEKREVWIISEEGLGVAIPHQADDDNPADGTVSITPVKQDEPDAVPEEKLERRN